jgi:hypothetical protein
VKLQVQAAERIVWSVRAKTGIDAKSGSAFAIVYVLASGCANVCESVGTATAEVKATDATGHTTIALHAPPPDPAHPSHVIAYLWSSTSGKIDMPRNLNATLTCERPGPIDVNIRITDGICVQSKVISLICPGDVSGTPNAKVQDGG